MVNRFVAKLQARVAMRALSRASVQVRDLEPLITHLEKVNPGSALARQLGVVANASKAEHDAVVQTLEQSLDKLAKQAETLDKNPALRTQASQRIQSGLLKLSGAALLEEGISSGFAEYSAAIRAQVRVHGTAQRDWEGAAAAALGFDTFKSALAAAETGASLDELRGHNRMQLALSGRSATMRELRQIGAQAQAVGASVSEIAAFHRETHGGIGIRDSLGSVHAAFDELAGTASRRSLAKPARVWRAEFYDLVTKTARAAQHLPQDVGRAAEVTKELLEALNQSGVTGVADKKGLAEKLFKITAGDGLLRAQLTRRVRDELQGEASRLAKLLPPSKDPREAAVERLIEKREREAVLVAIRASESTSLFDESLAKDLTRTTLGSKVMGELLEQRLQALHHGAVSVEWLKEQGLSTVEAATIADLAERGKLSRLFHADLSQGIDALVAGRARRARAADSRLSASVGPPTVVHQVGRWVEAMKNTPTFLAAGGIAILVADQVLSSRQLRKMRVLLKSSTKNVVIAARAAAGRTLAEARAQAAAETYAAKALQSARSGRLRSVYEVARSKTAGAWGKTLARLRPTAGSQKIGRLGSRIQAALRRTAAYARNNAAVRLSRRASASLRFWTTNTIPRHVRALREQARLSYRAATQLDKQVLASGRLVWRASLPQASKLADNVGTRAMQHMGSVAGSLNAGFRNSIGKLASLAGKRFPRLARVLQTGLRGVGLGTRTALRLGGQSARFLAKGLQSISKVLGRIPMLSLLTEVAFALPDIVAILSSDLPLEDKVSALSQVYGRVGWNVLYSPMEMTGAVFGFLGADQISRDVSMFGREAYAGIHAVGTHAFEHAFGVYDGFSADNFGVAYRAAGDRARAIGDELFSKYQAADERLLQPKLQEYMHAAQRQWRESEEYRALHRTTQEGVGEVDFSAIAARLWAGTGARVFQDKYAALAAQRVALEETGARFAAGQQQTGARTRFDTRRADRTNLMTILESRMEGIRGRFLTEWKEIYTQLGPQTGTFLQWADGQGFIQRTFGRDAVPFLTPAGYQAPTIAVVEQYLESQGHGLDALREFGDYELAVYNARILLSVTELRPILQSARTFLVRSPASTAGAAAQEMRRKDALRRLGEQGRVEGGLRGFDRAIVQTAVDG